MSLEQFITDILNVKSDDIQEIYHLKQSDESLIIKVKLKRTLLSCPYCRKKSYLINYFSRIKHDTFDYTTNKSELNNVRYVLIDLSENFKSIAKTYFPNATICADSFHVIENLNRCFRNIRLRCRTTTDNPTYKYFLIKFRFVFYHKTFLDNEPRYNKRLGEYINYRGIRDILLAEFPELKVAYELREYYLELNNNCTIADATHKIDQAISLFADSGIPELDEFHNHLINWREEIINSFTTINGKRINNSYIESKNRILEKLIYNANGFTNFKRTRNRILYCLNKDSGFRM